MVFSTLTKIFAKAWGTIRLCESTLGIDQVTGCRMTQITSLLRSSSIFLGLAACVLAGCATESHQALKVEKPTVAAVAYTGARSDIAVGKFDNRSNYMRGLFSDGVDRLGGQAKTILVGHLQESGRFNVLDRDNMEEIAREAQLAGKQQALKGAEVTITGDVVEFGRKEVGDRQLFGILGSGKRQVAYSKVTLNVVDVLSSQVLYSVSGAGEYELSSREVIGFGGASSYDSTLNGKVLDLAIREAVDRLAEALDKGSWTPNRKGR
jgi:curli biogenesis system outer membrane secretion channel CsgG